MKKFLSILAILAAVMLTSSCQKELPDAIKNIDVSQGGQTPASPEISLDMNSMEFTAESGSKAFNIKSNTSWTVSSNQTWCSVSPTSGKNNGSVTVKVSENTQTSARTATVTVKSEIGILTVKVTQNEANAAISLDTSTMEFTSSSGEQAFKITANTSWAVSSDQTWCSVNPTSGSNNGSVTVKVSENTQTSARTATISVKTDAGIRTVSVTQNGASEQVSLSVSDMEFAAGSGSKIFSIKSNTTWAVSSDKNWCSVSPTSGSGDGSVTVSVDENTSSSSRTATITVESATITRRLAVTQNGATPVTPPSSQDRSFTVGGVTFKMIAVEGGTFTMGATSEQGSEADSDEKPTHSVTLSSYSIGETEVTQALWQAVMGQNPTSDGSQWSSTYGLGGNYPAYYVSWNDCQDFIRRLNALTGENFRLPTEAEWEYAARGGNKSRGYKYAGSNTLGNVAWYWDNIPSQSSGSAGYGTQVVATKSPNELGLYDMSGNVYEWCQDWYGSYSSGSQTNPTGPGSGADRVYRGGSWTCIAWRCRVSLRFSYYPTFRTYGRGLRLAL